MKELAKLTIVDWAMILALLLPAVAVWFVVIRRWQNGKPAIEPRPRRAVAWTGVDLIAILILFTTTCAATAYSLGIELDPQSGQPEASQLPLFIMAQSIGSVLAVPICASLLVFRWHGTPRDLGLPTSWAQLAGDLRLGAAGFAAAAFPVLLLHMALAELLKDILPYKHKVYESLLANPSSSILLLMAFSTIIAAPLWEEFSFRLVLQGWMQKVVRESAAERVASGDVANPPELPLLPPALSWLPIVGSSLAFASTHFGQGPAPIPIFFLGLILGYIFRQTQRILPCILLHMLFNSVGIATAWIAIQTGQLPQ